VSGVAALLRHQVRRHRIVMVLVPLGLFVFHWFFTRVAPSEAETQRFGAMLSFLPPAVLDAIGLRDAMSVTARGVLSFGYVHPFTLLLLSLWTVGVTCGGLAGEMGEGTMDLVASRPVSRTAIVLCVVGTAVAGIVVAVAAAWSGTALGLATRDLGELPATLFLTQAAGLAQLFAAWAGVALAVSATHRRGGTAIGLVSGVMAVMFALDYIGRVYAPLRQARWLSPFAYLAPEQNRYLEVNATGTLVLGGLAVAGLAVALVAFRRRDL
jgi:ABC-type transport system involved in multi-copper enzyme maturation permease subunit